MNGAVFCVKQNGGSTSSKIISVIKDGETYFRGGNNALRLE
jgi:hypothetical protein